MASDQLVRVAAHVLVYTIAAGILPPARADQAGAVLAGRSAYVDVGRVVGMIGNGASGVFAVVQVAVVGVAVDVAVDVVVLVDVGVDDMVVDDMDVDVAAAEVNELVDGVVGVIVDAFVDASVDTVSVVNVGMLVG